MIQHCQISGEQFEVPSDDLRFLEMLAPKIGDKRYALPPPTISPRERQRKRLAFRNERRLFQRQCSLSGKNIVSMYSPDKPYPVYAKDIWWSDKWDPLAYGREIDWSRPFFEQLAELSLVAPRLCLVTAADADEYNSSFVNFAGGNKNCYMIFDSDFNEDSMYSNVLKHSRDCVDCSYLYSSELCYECVDCSRCYELSYSQNCSGCTESSFLYSCIGCTNCFGCFNLVQKQYWIFNEPVGKERYLQFISEQQLRSRAFVDEERARFSDFIRQAPRKYCQNLKVENCLGDHIENSKNCYQCFNISEGEDLRYCDSLYSAKSCMDVSSFGEKIERVYESGTIGVQGSDLYFCEVCVPNCSNLLYSIECRLSKHSFGCVSLKNNAYCILNKQYSAEDYAKTVDRLIHHMSETGEWGQFFPYSLASFGYNETIAQESFPLTRSEAAQLGAKWSEFVTPPPNVPTLTEIPDNISDIGEEILGKALLCEVSKKPFRVTKPELAFYQRVGVPLPRRHPDVRHLERMSERNPQQLWERVCAETGQPIFTSYSPFRQEIVYGEEAFISCLS